MLPLDRRPLTLRTIFDQVADDYDAVRPTYPAELVDDIITLAALPPHGAVFEVGCGTGQATIPFGQRGYQMTCIDIGPALAARAALACQAYPDVHIHVAAFEEWPEQPNAYDLVMSATAFHWIPPDVGYSKAARMLKQTGSLAIFSNEHPTPFTEFFADAQAIYQRVVPSWAGAPPDSAIEQRIAQTVATIQATGLFAPLIIKTYPWSQIYTTANYLRLLNTYSDYRNLPDDTRTELYAALAALSDTKYNGMITKPYLAVLFLARVLVHHE